jgi:pimeloyl-ACP methyl ester carboxylesterase
MSSQSKSTIETLKLQQARIEIERVGKGPPLLLLHGEDAFELNSATGRKLIEKLAGRYEVFLPRMPGFGKSTLPGSIRNIDDISYLWLDLLDHYDLCDATIIGFSVGGWLAAEIATKNCDRVSRLVLAGAVGVKFGGAYDRDIEDIYFYNTTRVREILFDDPLKDPHVDLSGLSKKSALSVARQRETIVKLCWDPYFHNPSLLHRLNRITCPSLVVWGTKDGMTEPKYGRAYARHIPDAQFVGIPRAGHFPHIEQPELFWRALDRFLAE